MVDKIFKKRLKLSIEREISRAKKFNYTICLAILQIKLVENIENILAIIRKTIHIYDAAIQSGEDEIAIILPYCTNRKAAPLLGRIKKEISNLSSDLYIGIATYPLNAFSSTELIKRAKESLEFSKKQKNKYVYSYFGGSTEKIKVGFCPPVMHPFYSYVLSGVKEIAEEVGNIELIVEVTPEENYTHEKQKQIINQFINKTDLDAIAICTKADISEEIEQLLSKNIKTFLFYIKEETNFERYKDYISFIGCDQKLAGKEVGKYLIRILRKKGKVAIIEGVERDSDSRGRKEGFLRIIKDYPQIELVAIYSGEWKRNKAKNITQKILDEHPDVDAIFCLSDEMALGAIDVLREKNKIGEIFVIGFDGNLNALESIAKGELTATLHTHPREIGKILMQNVLKIVLGKGSCASITTPTTVVDLENVNSYLGEYIL